MSAKQVLFEKFVDAWMTDSYITTDDMYTLAAKYGLPTYNTNREVLARQLTTKLWPHYMKALSRSRSSRGHRRRAFLLGHDCKTTANCTQDRTNRKYEVCGADKTCREDKRTKALSEWMLDHPETGKSCFKQADCGSSNALFCHSNGFDDNPLYTRRCRKVTNRNQHEAAQLREMQQQPQQPQQQHQTRPWTRSRAARQQQAQHRTSGQTQYPQQQPEDDEDVQIQQLAEKLQGIVNDVVALRRLRTGARPVSPLLPVKPERRS